MSCLHDYELVSETSTGAVEVCKMCKKRLVTKKSRIGRINNKEYLKEHRRDFMQPSDPRFKEVYGHSGDIKDYHEKKEDNG